MVKQANVKLEGITLNKHDVECVVKVHNVKKKSRPQGHTEVVQKCLDAKGVGCEEWEAEIDGRVATLYGL